MFHTKAKTTQSLPLQSKVLLEKLIVAQPIPPFVEAKTLLPCSQQPTSGPSPKLDEPSPHPHTPFPSDSSS